MTITYSAADTNYLDDRYALMTWLEGVTTYIYTDHKGYATIGTGFLVSENADVILQNMGLGLSTAQRQAAAAAITVATKSHNFGTTVPGDALNQAALDAINKALRDSTGNQNLNFEYTTDAQIENTFNVIAQKYDDTLNGWLPPNASPLADNHERLALFSLTYNGYIGAKYDDQGNFLYWKSPSLRNALQNGERAKAWYEIRYGSNAGSVGGVAKRHYEEAALFGLYNDNSNITPDDARAAYQMFTLHHDEIIAYDNKFTPNLGAANTDLQNAGLGYVVAKTNKDAFQPAADILVDKYGHGQFFDYLNIFAGQTTGGLINRAPDTDNDLIIGDVGNDFLIGGSGNDVFNSGAGLDVLNGNLGNDTYVYQTGDGMDTITDTAGVNAICVGTTQLTGTSQKSYTSGDLTVWEDISGAYTYAWNSQSHTLTIFGSALGAGNNSITLTDITKLSELKDRFGIELAYTVAAALTTASTNPYTAAGYTAADDSGSIGEQGSQMLNLALNTAAKAGDTITLWIDSVSGITQDLIKLVRGDEVIDFSSGSITLNASEGQNFLSFAILEQGNLDASASVTFKAVVESTDADGSSTTTDSNLYTLAIAGVDNSQPIQTTTDINGDLKPNDTVPDDPSNPKTMGIQAQCTPKAQGGNPNDGKQEPYEDILGGTAGNDHIMGGELNDDIGSGAGDDWIEGGNGNDYLHGETGNDLIEGGADSDILFGEQGDDRLFGDVKIDIDTAIENGNTDIGSGKKGDWLGGDDGDDTVVGSKGNDVLCGGAGKDLLIAGAGDDYILGDADYYAQYIWEGNGIVVTEKDARYIDITNTPNYICCHSAAKTFDWTVTEQDDGAYEFSPLEDFSVTDPAGSSDDVIYAGAGDDVAWGGAGNDTIYGEDGDDILMGDAGNDVLLGGAGKDIIYGGDENDYLDGGDGNDTLWGDAGDDTLMGGAGDDELYGEDGTNYLDGEDGNDTLNSGGDGSTLLGGAGDDKLSAVGVGNYLDGEEGNDTLIASGGSATLFGGAGDDDLTATDDDNYLDGEEGNNTLYAVGSNNTLFAGAGDDSLQAAGGNNYLDGGDGSNMLIANGGNNILIGGSGDDTLSASGSNNYLEGGEGNNMLIADGGGNTLIGGSGNDLLSATGGNNYLDGGNGNDTLITEGSNNTLMGGAGDDYLSAGLGGNNYLYGGGGSDTYAFSLGFGENHIIDGEGDNTVVFDFDSNGLQIGLGSLMLSFANGDVLHIDGYDPYDPFGTCSIGTFQFNDVTYSLQDILDLGGSAVDYTRDNGITGTAGDDLLQGTAGRDYLYGLAGNDTLDGGAGADVMKGGTGDDTYIVDNAGDQVVEQPGEGWDTVQSSVSYKLGDYVEELTLTPSTGSGQAALDLNGTGNALDNYITGNDGNNILTGGAGNDHLNGGAGADVMDVLFGREKCEAANDAEGRVAA